MFEIVKSPKLYSEIFANEDVDFGDYIKNNSLECSKRAMELKDSTLYSLCEFFSNIDRALKNKNKVDWNGLLSLMEYLIGHHDDEKYKPISYDPMFEVAKLLETALKDNLIDFTYSDRLLPILEKIAEIGTKNPLDDNNYLKENFMESLMISINDIDGMSFHVLVNYLLWYNKHNGKKKFIEPRIKQIFDDYLDKKFDKQTISRHAVFGLYLLRFYSLDKEWVDQILNKIKSNEKLNIAFWECYVRYNPLYVVVFQELHVWYGEMLNDGLLIKNKAYSVYNSTIDHMILAYFYDLDNADKYFEKFLNDYKDKTWDKHDDKFDNLEPLTHCAFYISSVIEGKSKDKEFNKEKLKKLWKHESFSKHTQLDWWFKNSPLDDEDTIKLYHNYLERYSGNFNLIYSEIPELEKYIKKHPVLVAKCLRLLVTKQVKNYIPKPDVKNILESLLKRKQDDNVRDICKEIIEFLKSIRYDYSDLLQ